MIDFYDKQQKITMGGTTKANTTATSTSLIVEIMIPSHISVSAAQRRHRRFLPSVSIDDDDDGDGDDDDDDLKQQQQQFLFCLHCYYCGSMWRGIAPILLEAPTEWAQRFIYLLSLSYSPKSTNNNENRPILTDSCCNNNIVNNETNRNNNKKHIPNGDNNEDHEDDNEHENERESNTHNNNVLYHRRRISYPKTNIYQNKIIKHLNINHNNLQNNGKQKQKHDGSITTINPIRVTIWIQPPDISMEYSSIDRIFGSLVNRHEKLLLQKQTLSAWMSTLGGGYFFCRRLSKSLLLSQQQQLIAKQLNDHHLQQQCQINEIFNWLYIGNFQMALTKIEQLENEISIVSTTTTISPPSSLSSSSTNNNNNNNITTITTTNSTVYRQCQAARVLADRLQKFQRKLHKYHTGEHGIVHAIDDYQRIRLVQEDFE